jgi:outer membrane protein TolC
LFQERVRQLEEMESMTSAKVRPKLSGFGQAGLGRPPDLDLFNDDLAPFLVVGIRLHWQFWDWSRSSRERQIRGIEKEIVSTEREAFSRRIAVQSEIQLAEIARLDSLIETDQQVIVLRERVADDAAAKLESGTITATDYLIERNQAYRAQLQRAIHEIQRAAARVEYATTIGAYL